MILICGIPNAGKTTYSSRYADVIHYDDMNLTTRQRYAELKRLAQEGNAIVEGVFGESKRRKELADSCPSAEKKICIWIDTPLEECLEREKNYRKRQLGLVQIHHKTFEPPTLDEGWDEIIIKR